MQEVRLTLSVVSRAFLVVEDYVLLLLDQHVGLRLNL
jgi:hypothetical protein